ncbi:hypothetical protein [Streptomyces sp. NPDC005046]
MAVPEITGSYETLLGEQAQELNTLKIRAGNPSLRDIEKQALALFAAEGLVSLPPSTLSGMFNGSYAGRDRLLWLVRTLMSWNRPGQHGTPPDYGAPELDFWYDRWEAITKARPRARTTPRTTVQAPGDAGRRPRVDTEPAESPASEDPQSSLDVPHQSRAEPAPRTPAVKPESILEAVQTFTLHAGLVLAVAFSPDGTLLATSSDDGTVRLWDPATRQPIGQPLTGHTRTVTAGAFSPDGTLLATSSDDTVRLWVTPLLSIW